MRLSSAFSEIIYVFCKNLYFIRYLGFFCLKKRKKLSKELYKVKKFYLDNPEKKVVILNDTDFKFRHPVDVLQDE